MSNQNWYRNTAWTPEIQSSFFARLERSRSNYNKAQYLRIQAYTLQHESNPPLFDSALTLLDLLITDYPEPSELASAYLQRARCLDAIGRVTDATQSYLSSFAAEGAYSTIKTTVPIEFALFVIRHKLKKYYNLALRNLKGRESLTIFPIGQYQAFGSMAIIMADQGKIKEARIFAKGALAAAQKTDSGLQYHPTLGLVEHVDSDFHSKLESIANSNEGSLRRRLRIRHKF